jgi:hypothetical protein
VKPVYTKADMKEVKEEPEEEVPGISYSSIFLINPFNDFCF